MEKLNCEPMKSSESVFKCISDDSKNTKKITGPMAKRYSIDNYWLSNSSKAIDCEQFTESDTLAQTDPSLNGHVSYHHRRSLSENIIPFQAHTTPSDKARCHLINRKTNAINGDELDDSSDECPIEIFSNTTLRKVAETMFLKDPQYKPHLKKQTLGKSNPFTTLTQLKGVKKIIGANPGTYTAGVCDLFSSCFEISLPFSKDLSVFPQRNGTGKTKNVQQAKSLPSSPKISQRKLSKIDKIIMKPSKIDDDSIFNSCSRKNISTEIELDVPNQCQTNCHTNDMETDGLSQTGTLKKKNASSLFSHPLFKCKDDRLDDGFYFDNPKILTRGGSSESGFFSCFTDEEFSTHKPLPKYSINCPNDYESQLSNMDDGSSIVLSSLRSLDDVELFERNRKLDCSANATTNDSLSIDMDFVNRLSLDSEINSLFHKNLMSNQLLYCKNRTSSIYTDSSEDISSLAGSDSLLWDDRMSSIPNTRSAQIAKIVEYFERKGQNFKSTNANGSETGGADDAGGAGGNFNRNQLTTISSHNYYSTASKEFLPYENNNIPIGVRNTDTDIKPIDFHTAYQTTSKEYEAFCLDLDKGMTLHRLNVCDGVVKSKLQLFDKLRNNKKEL